MPKNWAEIGPGSTRFDADYHSSPPNLKKNIYCFHWFMSYIFLPDSNQRSSRQTSSMLLDTYFKFENNPFLQINCLFGTKQIEGNSRLFSSWWSHAVKLMIKLIQTGHVLLFVFSNTPGIPCKQGVKEREGIENSDTYLMSRLKMRGDKNIKLMA